MTPLVPGLPEPVEEQPRASRHFALYRAPKSTQRDRDAFDHEKGRLLLERLRYKMYVRHGTLGGFMLHIGGQVRSGSGPWYWLALATAMGSYWSFCLRFLR